MTEKLKVFFAIVRAILSLKKNNKSVLINKNQQFNRVKILIITQIPSSHNVFVKKELIEEKYLKKAT